MNVTAHPAPAATDAEEFAAYVRERSPALLRTAYLITGNRFDAEDLLQTALAKVYLAWPRIKDKGAADGYVRRTLVNAHTSRWRLRRVAEYPAGILPEEAGTTDPFAAHDLHDVLWRALERLTRRQRTAVVLRYYLDLSEAETAAILGISIGTVKSTMHHALAKLRTDLTLRDEPVPAARTAAPAARVAPAPVAPAAAPRPAPPRRPSRIRGRALALAS
jgi:RNA polymerase sigma-70 factor (sigma-E family)